MALLTLADAENIAGRRRPWTIRLEYHDAANNSHKFWFATGRAHDEGVECGWGRVGNKPQLKPIDWRTLRDKVSEKLAKGYDWEPTPYVRMSAKTIAHFDSLKAKPAPSKSQGAASVSAPPKPQAAPAAPQQPKPTPAPAQQAQGPAVHVNPALPAPFGFIKWLKPTKSGWEALDSNKDRLLDLPHASGKTMLRDFPQTVFILT
jgi:predicted DNA-binding WGR domain protein